MKIITRDGMFIEGEFSPEQLSVIISRAGIETPKDEVTAEIEPAIPADAEQAKESPLPKAKQLPQHSAEPHDSTGYSTNMGGLCDTFDPDKGQRGFQFQMPPMEQ